VGTFWSNFKEQISKIFDRMTPLQRSMVITVTIVSIVALVAVMTWASRADYSPLYSGLSGKDAGRILEKLREMKVDFQLENDGTTILVPTRRMHELRIEFASMGLPRSGEIGYEVFDKTNIGMTAFVQKLNFHRALEGELARTICQLEEIDQARVHIVIPETALFEEDKKETTASVVVRVSPHADLTKKQVEGIAYLVAFSVEGLSAHNVNIVDTNGNMLTDSMDPSQAIQVTSRQMELQRDVESYLKEKAQSLLNGILGPGKSHVRISVVMDFDRIEKTKEMFDPERSVVRSEERSEITSSSGQQEPSGGNSSEENNITNYEIDKTVEHLVESVGEISRVSASVLVDGEYKTVTDAQGEETYQFQERPPNEMATITEVVKNAIGYDAARNDQISVQCYPFDTSYMEEERQAMAAAEKRSFWLTVAERLILGVLVILAFLFLKSVVKRSQRIAQQLLPPAPVQRPQALETGSRPQQMLEPSEIDAVRAELENEKMPSEHLRQKEIHRRIRDYVKEKPNEATQLLRSWMIEG
jgi:flagellar M-ring protein FliF